MPLIAPPKELRNVRVEYNALTHEWELSKNATDEQKKAYEKYNKMIKESIKKTVIFEE